jgi:hypothetical protein
VSDELEPLPESHDPYVILGVDEAADARELKRAYARRIKVYRPDRAPDAFARIQAAFEHAQAMIAMRAMVAAGEAEAGEAAPAASSSAAEPGPADGAAEPAATAAGASTAARRHDLLHALAAATDARDDHLAQLAWTAVTDAGGTLEVVCPGAPPSVRRWLLTRQPVTWRELSRWDDLQNAFVAWLESFALRLRDPRLRPGALEMVRERALLTDASHEPAAAILALKAVSSLAWLDWTVAADIFGELRHLVSHPVVEALHDRATLDVEAGQAWHRRESPRLPPLLLELLAEAPLNVNDESETLRARVRDSLDGASRRWMTELDAGVGRDRKLCEALAHRLLDGVPTRRRELMVLPEKVGAALTREMRRAGRWTFWIVPLLVVLCGLALAPLAWEALEGYQIERKNDDDASFYGAFGVIGLACVAALALDLLIYRLAIRWRMAAVLGRVGVTRAAARQWLATSWWRVRLRRFSPWMERDESLRLLGLVAAQVAADPPDER